MPGREAAVVAVRVAFPLILLTYAGLAITLHWWPSSAGAAIVAWLLWRRHPRARFGAYILLSILTVRALVSAIWPLAIFALGLIVLLQLPAARRVWPRLTWGRLPR